MSQAIRALQKEYGTSFETVFQSITSDNGSEFADLTSCLEHTATEVYYAHPFSSWERGANEQNNGMIRRFIPKGIDPRSVTSEMVRRVESWLNHYPRKVFGYASSFDVFYQYTSSHAARFLYHFHFLPYLFSGITVFWSCLEFVAFKFDIRQSAFLHL